MAYLKKYFISASFLLSFSSVGESRNPEKLLVAAGEWPVRFRWAAKLCLRLYTCGASSSSAAKPAYGVMRRSQRRVEIEQECPATDLAELQAAFGVRGVNALAGLFDGLGRTQVLHAKAVGALPAAAANRRVFLLDADQQQCDRVVALDQALRRDPLRVLVEELGDDGERVVSAGEQCGALGEVLIQIRLQPDLSQGFSGVG
jgi:hypothetical protein